MIYMTQSKETTLSEKRKRLRRDGNAFSVQDILDLVEQQDKEFIRRYLDWLKTKNCHCESCSADWIKGNAGKELSEVEDKTLNSVAVAWDDEEESGVEG